MLSNLNVLIVASDKGGCFTPFVEEQITALQARGVEIMRYAVTGKGILGYLKELPKLKRYIRINKPDIIHAHFGLCGLLANLQRLVPVVTTYHGSDINVPSILRFSKLAMRLSKANIFVSKRNIALAGYSEDISVATTTLPFREGYGVGYFLPCGVNLTDDQLTIRTEARKALGIADDAKIVLFAGAFNNAIKDPELAKETIFEVNRMISLSLEGVLISAEPRTIASQNDSSETLSILSSNNNAPSLTGEIELKELKGFSRIQVNQLMCAANSLLMTSRTEGSPQVIKEAMACGCPIVSVDVGDVAERTSGVEGCYVVPSREPKDIAQAILQAIAYEGKTNGRERIIEMGLSNEQVAERLIEIYKQVIK